MPKRDHREAVFGRGRGLRRAVGRDVGRDQVDGVEIQRRVGGQRRRQMSVMERVEGATEKADTAGARHS